MVTRQKGKKAGVLEAMDGPATAASTEVHHHTQTRHACTHLGEGGLQLSLQPNPLSVRAGPPGSCLGSGCIGLPQPSFEFTIVLFNAIRRSGVKQGCAASKAAMDTRLFLYVPRKNTGINELARLTEGGQNKPLHPSPPATPSNRHGSTQAF